MAHTIKVIAAGFGLLGLCLLIGAWLGSPSVTGLATAAKVFIPLWLAGASINMWLGVTKAKWMQAVKKARGSFEPFGARRHIMARYTTDLPNAPRGQYVLFQYETSVSGDRQVVETVIPVLEGKRGWRVSGYFIRPDE